MTGELLKAFFLILAAEMGDKTQILAMAFATRYPVKKVLLGIFIGSFLNHGIAVALGSLISRKIPLDYIQIAAGLAFVIFAIWTLREEDDEEEENEKIKHGAVITVAVAFFIGELGDKTQLAAITLGASSGFPILTLIGTVSGMVVIGGLGIVIGKTLGDRIPEVGIKLGAASIFLIFGLSKLYTNLPANYLSFLYVFPFIFLLSLVISYMLYKMYQNRKEGKTTLYLKKAKELHEYYQKAKKNINSICLGVDNCGICEDSKCTVGQIKKLIDKGLNGDDIEIDRELNENWKDKNFDEAKLRIALTMTLNMLKENFADESYNNIHRIRINLEKMIFKNHVESAQNWEEYKVKMTNLGKKAEKFIKNIERN